VDIQSLKEVFRPEVWEALRAYVLGEVREELESRLRMAFAASAPPLELTAVPARAALPPKRKSRARGDHHVEFPPPLDPATLAYVPAKIRRMGRKYETIALRRDLIVEVLKSAPPDGVSVEDILAHLAKANFPIDNAYYTAVSRAGRPRIRAAIGNDLGYFLMRKWARRLAGGRWKWARSKSYEKE